MSIVLNLIYDYCATDVVFNNSILFTSDSQTSGIFLHNAAEQWIDISYTSKNLSSAYFIVESAAFDLFLFLGPGPKEVVRQMTDLVGRAPLPQVNRFSNIGNNFSCIVQALDVGISPV